MPWNSKTFQVVTKGLRKSAENGHLVTRSWIKEYKHNGRGCTVHGCAWGIIGYWAAVSHFGARTARKLMPVGCSQSEVNHVLKLVGLTQAEIDMMKPSDLWQEFDNDLDFAYANRDYDPEAFRMISMQLAEMFISALETIPVVEEKVSPLQTLRQQLRVMIQPTPYLSKLPESIDEPWCEDEPVTA